jgi:hypothetical protein
MTTGHSNVARDQARVGVQVGIIHGNANIYNVANASDPAEKYRVGVNYLNGHIPGKAEELISDAVAHGYRKPEVAYYWVLALLSGRTFDQLDDADFDKINTALEIARYDAGDATPSVWLEPLEVVVQLIQCLALHEAEAHDDRGSFYNALSQYERLPDARRDEIRRHLDMILVGGVQDQIDELDADEIRRERMGSDRLTRVPKFFLPTPAEPRRRALRGRPDVGVAKQQAITGLVLLAGGELLTLIALRYSGLWALAATPIIAVLWAVGLYALVHYGRAHLRRMAKVGVPAKNRLWYLASYAEIVESSTQRAVDTDLSGLVDDRFGRSRPAEISAEVWMRETAPLRASVAQRVRAQYGWNTTPAWPLDVDWLVSWHAGEAAKQWVTTRTVQPMRSRAATPVRITPQLAFGQAAVLLVILMQVAMGFWAGPLLGTLVMAATIGGVALVYVGLPKIVLVEESGRLDERAQQQEFEDEERAFRRWTESLRDRPTDAEIARWLDYDKAHIKNLALRAFRLRNRDLIGHVTLSQSDLLCWRAREIYGPPRYSAYQIRVFLLTEHGVREFHVHLNFTTGATFNEQRNSFGYRAITSAEVGQVSVEYDNGRQKVVSVDPDSETQPASQKFTLAQALHLTLNNGRATFVLIENFDLGLIDRIREDSSYLNELARDAAGVNGALQILEAIAAEGERWVEEERKRRNRRLRHYQERQRRRQLSAGPGSDLNFEVSARPWQGSAADDG